MMVAAHIVISCLNILPLKHIEGLVLHYLWVIHILRFKHRWSICISCILVYLLCKIGIKRAHVPSLCIASHIHPLAILICHLRTIQTSILVIEGSISLTYFITGRSIIWILICLCKTANSPDLVLLMRTIMRYLIRRSFPTYRLDSVSSCGRFASLHLSWIVYLLDFSFLLVTMASSFINSIINLGVHHHSVLLLQSHLSSIVWVSTDHCTPYWFVIIIKLIF